MKIIKCNVCNTTIDPMKAPYYEVECISFHHPKSKYSRLIREESKDPDSVREEKTTESWCHYADLDFCTACWEREKFSRFTPD